MTSPPAASGPLGSLSASVTAQEQAEAEAARRAGRTLPERVLRKLASDSEDEYLDGLSAVPSRNRIDHEIADHTIRFATVGWMANPRLSQHAQSERLRGLLSRLSVTPTGDAAPALIVEIARTLPAHLRNVV